MISTPIANRTFYLLAAFFIVIAVPGAYFGISRMFSEWNWLSDMHYFYDGALVVVDGRADILYDLQARYDAGYGFHPNDQVFPYPATLAYLLAPLTLTDVEMARYVFMAGAIATLALIALAGWIWSRDLRFGLLILLAAGSSFAVYEALRFQQLSPVLALMLCMALLGNVSRMSMVGGILAGLVVVKPTVAVAPLGLISLRRGYQQIAAFAVTAALIVIVIPLLTVGLDGIRDYLELLSRYRHESFTLHGHLTAGAGWMLGWQSIVGRLMRADPDPYIVIPLCGATLIVMGRVWLRGQYFESFLAGTLTTLLIVPHVLWYDWVILLGVAPFALYSNRSLPLVFLLLALHVAISFDSYMIVIRPSFDAYPVPTPILAGTILFYLAFAPRRKEVGEVETMSRGAEEPATTDSPIHAAK